MKRKNIILMSILMICLVLTSCELTFGEKTLKADTPENAIMLLRIELASGIYENFNALFSQGRKSTISVDKFNEMKSLTTTGAENKLYKLLIYENGEMFLVGLSPVKLNDENKIDDKNGEYKIEDIVIVPEEMKEIFKSKYDKVSIGSEKEEYDEVEEYDETELNEEEKEELFNNSIAHLSEEDKKICKERRIKLNELQAKLQSITSLEEVIDEYLCYIDGWIAEGYGGCVYEMYSNEGMDKFISILNKKEEPVVKGVIDFLFGELIIQGNTKEIDEIIDYMNKLDTTKFGNKELNIVTQIIETAKSAKTNIY